MVGKNPGVREDSMLLKNSPFPSLPISVQGFLVGVRSSVSYSLCVIFQGLFYALVCSFLAYILKVSGWACVLLIRLLSALSLQPFIKVGITLSEGLPQGFLLVETVWLQVRLLDLRHTWYFPFCLVWRCSIYHRFSFHTCFPLAFRVGRKKKALEFSLLSSLISVFWVSFHSFKNKFMRDGIFWVFPVKCKRSC